LKFKAWEIMLFIWQAPVQEILFRWPADVKNGIKKKTNYEKLEKGS
jgi:hypothetical protein